MKNLYISPEVEFHVIRREDIFTDSQNDDIYDDIWDGTINPEIFT